MKKIALPGIVAGIAMLAVGMGLSYVFSLVFPSLFAEYNNTALFRPWSDPLMSIYFAHPFVAGLVLAWAWDKTKKLFTGSAERKGAYFGLSYWVVASIPGMVITYSSFPLSFLIVLTWTLSSLVSGVVAGIIFAKMNK